MSNTVWVLTREINQYDQDGAYFERVFKDKPTKQQLLDAGVYESSVEHVLSKGGRIKYEDTWWYLTEVKI